MVGLGRDAPTWLTRNEVVQRALGDGLFSVPEALSGTAVVEYIMGSAPRSDSIGRPVLRVSRVSGLFPPDDAMYLAEDVERWIAWDAERRLK